MKRDDQYTIQDLKDIVAQFSKDRNWGERQTPKNLATFIAIEAAQLLEYCQWEYYGDETNEKLNKADKKYPIELFNPIRPNGDAHHYFRIKKAYYEGKNR